jgi:hypothetical protein
MFMSKAKYEHGDTMRRPELPVVTYYRAASIEVVAVREMLAQRDRAQAPPAVEAIAAELVKDQRDAVQQFLDGRPWSLRGEHFEFEGDKRVPRSALRTAIEQARQEHATLVLARFADLALDLDVLVALKDANVDFSAVDLPSASRYALPLLIELAEWKRTARSVRASSSLAAAKGRGVVLGAHGRALALLHKKAAEARVALIAEALRAMRAEGLSVRAMVERLNAIGVPSPGGGRWHPSSLQAALARLQLTGSASDVRTRKTSVSKRDNDKGNE